MYNFLNDRSKYKDQKVVSQTLDNLTLINKKTEELIENIYKQINPKEAEKNIEIADNLLKASQFYNRALNLFDLNSFNSDSEVISKIDPKKYTWYDYLVQTGEFELVENWETPFADDADENIELWLKPIDSPKFWSAKIKKGKAHPKIRVVASLYENLKEIDKNERKKALEMTANNTGLG